MSEFLRSGAERWQQERDIGDRAAKRVADDEAAFEAHLERRINEATAAIAAFLELMAEHGNPGLRRWRITQTDTAMIQKPARLLGWKAWREAANLNPKGRFRVEDKWVSEREYLRRTLGARVPSAHFSRAATTVMVDERWRTFCEMLGSLLARHQIAVPEAPTADTEIRGT